MPLPSPPDALDASNRRKQRTPSGDNNAPAAASLATAPALVADTSTVPGVPSGKRTTRHGTRCTLLRPSTTSRVPHNGCHGAVIVTSPGNDGRNSRSLCSWSSRVARPT